MDYVYYRRDLVQQGSVERHVGAIRMRRRHQNSGVPPFFDEAPHQSERAHRADWRRWSEGMSHDEHTSLPLFAHR
jgi:hypothetical protein